MKQNPDDVRRYRLELRRLGSSYGIQLPTIDGGLGNYRKEHEALMVDFALIVAALKKMEAESPEKYAVIREAANKVLEMSESFRKM
jgi:tRNA A-37 threonylcarbamoyl transferase component Bud32